MLAPQTECFSNIVQDFLICTTIHKARQLGVFQGAIYVRLALDKMVRHTKTYENSENPYFNEYFVFEIKCTLMELLRMTILYEVKRQTMCKKNPILGELLIDMQSVWNQPNRCYFKKWGRLETPLGLFATMESGEVAGDLERGFIQIDLTIVSQATNPDSLLRPHEEDILALNKWHLNQDYDDIEKNMLHNVDTGLRCNIRYKVTFYRGIMATRGDYILQFRFHSFKGKTNVAKNTQKPCWNQEISFVWCYPSLSQTLAIQLLYHDHLQWKCIAEYEVHFNEIAFKDKPSLGPTFLNLYDNMSGYHYMGRLLLAIESECLETEANHVATLKHVAALEEIRFWKEETFFVEFLVLQGDFVHCNSSTCKLMIKLAEQTSNSIECTIKNYPTTFKKREQPIKILKYFVQPVPFKSITLKIQLPDNRIKYDLDILLDELMDVLKSEIELFKLFQIQYEGHNQSQLKVLRAIILAIIERIEHVLEGNQLEYTSFKEATQWDLNRLIYFKDYFHKMLDDFKSLRAKIKPSPNDHVELVVDGVVADLIKYCNELEHLLSNSLLQDAWPDLCIVLLAGNKELGFCRLNAINFMYPAKEHEPRYNSQCWKMKSFIFKDMKCRHTCVNCGCTVAIVRGCLSIVNEPQTSEFLSQVARQWNHSEPLHWSPVIPFINYKCRLFIHQAKIRPGSDRNGLCDPYARIIICNCAAETAILFSSLSPIWNTVISFDNIRLPGDFLWYLNNPPLVAIEVYDTDKKTAYDYLGSGILPLSVIKSDWVEWYARENEGWASDEIRTKHSVQKYELLKYLSPPPLKWIPIALNGTIRAEVLVSGELVEKDHNEQSNKVDTCRASVTVGIPNAIKPNMKNFVLEVIFAGLRNYRKRNFLTSKHRVKVMMANLVLTSGLTTSPIKTSINFLVPYASGIVSLPEQLEYWPPIIATDVAISNKDEETTLGATLIANSKRYLQKEKTIACISEEEYQGRDSNFTCVQLENETESESETSDSQPLINIKPKDSYWQMILEKLQSSNNEIKPLDQADTLKEILDESEYNWWTKFYNSGFIEPCGALSDLKHKLCIYQNELEKEVEFSYFNDWADSFSMVHGIKYKKNVLPREEIYANLKLHLKITPCNCDRRTVGRGGDAEMLKPLTTAINPRYQAQLQSLAELVKITVRVYIVQGIQLRPNVKNIQADSYVKIQLGQKLVANRADFVPHQSNPIFGKCFQLEGLLPREHILEVSVFNRKDVKDETIGSTFIDLEDRWRSKHRATVGIANEYCSTGYNRWHDCMLPSEILNDLCRNKGLGTARIAGNKIEVDGVSFTDQTEIATSEDLQERLCLTVLRNFEHLPSFGYKLVPQHVETRSLFRNDCPGIEQGKIQLWIELYDGNLNIPQPIDIAPQPPEWYELRVVVCNASQVILDETNIFGTAMSDVYVKGWCSNFDEAQYTDIHYRSINGEGNFNWRMLFPLNYSHVEDVLVAKRRTGLMEEYEFKQPPILYLQIWDNDFISPDDFLGSLEINLSGFPEPYGSAKKCELLDETHSITAYGSTITRVAKTKSQRKLINLFKKKKVRGWFPMRGNVKDKNKSGHIGLAGKIELEMEVLTEAEAKLNPAGLGRNGPNSLEEPNRPKTSFHPFKNPWKSTQHILLPKVPKLIFLLLLLFIIGLALVHIFSKLPLIIAGWIH